MTRKVCLGLFLAAIVLAAPAFGETFNIDLNPSTPAPDTSIQAAKGSTLTVNLVVTNAVDLMGVSADVLFDATNALELTDIQSTFGDLDFSSIVSFQEIMKLISFYLAETAVDQFVDQNGNHSGILVDKNRDNIFGFTEIMAGVSQYVAAEGGTQFWTMNLANDGNRTAHSNESVPVFDPVAKSNVGGQHPGLVEDITAVLLRRPEGSTGGASATGFGYDSANYGGAPAIICTMKFKVKSTAPTGQTSLTFGKSVMIRETFADINNDIITAGNAPSQIDVQ